MIYYSFSRSVFRLFQDLSVVSNKDVAACFRLLLAQRCTHYAYTPYDCFGGFRFLLDTILPVNTFVEVRLDYPHVAKSLQCRPLYSTYAS